MASSPVAPLDIGGLSSNLISDFGPILSLFGEQVANQFMSQLMGWIDNIIFSMAPLGIITAVVGAIRIGGPGWLKAIIGRARENRATSEVELMSSTSHEVCELWDGQNIVRIMGAPEVRELIYISETATEKSGTFGGDSVSGRQSVGKAGDCGLYSLDQKDSEDFLYKRPKNMVNSNYLGRKLDTVISKGESDYDTESATETSTSHIHNDNRLKCAPNISLNIHSYVSEWELYVVAIIGTVLQTAVLFYSYNSVYDPSLRSKLGVSTPEFWAWYCTLAGTLSVVIGMMGCCYIIEKSTDEESYSINGGEGHILWLQKDETVNDQVFNSYAIFAKNKRSVVMTSRRNTKLTDTNGFDAHIFGYGTTVAAILSLVGFIIQFIGLRGMHWSASVAQVLATIVMAVLRAFVRRGLSECPYAQQLPPGHEMDWLATRFAVGSDRLKLWEGPGYSSKKSTQSWRTILGRPPVHNQELSTHRFWEQGCYNWSIITSVKDNGYEPLGFIDSEIPESCNSRAQAVLDARKRLGYLTQWPGDYSDIATSVAASIDHVMNMPRLFNSNAKEFMWSMNVDVGQRIPETIKFRVEKVSNRWKADLAEIEAALSLWIFSVYENEKSQSSIGNRDDKGWLRSGKASKQQGIRLLGPSTPLLRRDLKWCMGDGLEKVLEVDLSEQATDDCDIAVPINFHDYRVMGFGGRQMGDVVYKARPLPEVSIEGDFGQEVISTILEYITASGSNYQNKDNVATVTSEDPETEQELLPGLPTVPEDNVVSIHSQESGTREELELCLATIPETSLSLLFAQEMFSVFMWAFAQSPEVNKIRSQTTVKPQLKQSLSSGAAWKSFTLQNTMLSGLAQSIERTGLGSLGEVYMSIIPPLSAHGRLPDPGIVVDHIHQQTKWCQINNHWEDAKEMYLWVFLACSHEIPDLGHSTNNIIVTDPKASTKAAAVLMDFLRALGVQAERYEKQKCDQATETSRFLKKLRHDLALTLRNSSGEKRFHDLAWLYKKRSLGVDWEPLLSDHEVGNYQISTQKLASLGVVPLTQSPQDGYGEISFNSEKEANQMDALGWAPLHCLFNNKDGFNKKDGSKGDRIKRLVKAGADWRLRDLGGWIPLHYAAMDESFNLKWTNLREKGDINAQGRDGLSPLHCAAISGNLKLATLLVESGANLHAFDALQKTPLHWAAYYRHKEIVSLLLGYGAIHRAIDEFGRTPLHLAAMQGANDVVESLLKVGSETINARGGDGLTALQLAASNGQKEVVKILLSCRADANAGEGTSGNALHLAAAGGSEEIVELLLKHKADINAQSGFYGSALQAAAARRHIGVVKILLENKADVNAEGGLYKNALQAAVVGGYEDHMGGVYVEIAKVLLECGANVSARGVYGTALQALATVGGCKEMVEVLLENRADISEKTGLYGNALQIAAANGRNGIVGALLENGADVNAGGGHYGYALQTAVACGHVEIVKTLLEHNADVNAQGGFYGNALRAAFENLHGEIVRVLLQYGADINAQVTNCGNTLKAAILGGQEEILRVLLEHGVDTSLECSNYGNALLTAAAGGKIEIVNILLEHGVDINIRGGLYVNALQTAAAEGHTEIVKILLEKDADISVEDNFHGSALQTAAGKGHQEIVKILLDHKADVNAQGGFYGNALQAATANQHIDTVRLLLEKGANANAEGGIYGNALNAANGYEELATVLLEYGARTNKVADVVDIGPGTD